MFLVLTGPDAALISRALDYLKARSFAHAEVTGLDSALRVAGTEDGHHHVVTGVDGVEEAAPFLVFPDTRIAFLGEGAGPLRELAHLVASGERAIHELSALAKEGMAAFARPDWDDYFMDIAHVVARRSNCMKRKVAAIIVRDRRIVTTGYNGTPRGARNCNEGGCPRCNSLTPAGTELGECLCSHAEENAIVQAAFHGFSVRGGMLYCTFSPCLNCTKLIINAGIAEVIYNARYPMAGQSLRLMDECDVVHRQYEKK